MLIHELAIVRGQFSTDISVLKGSDNVNADVIFSAALSLDQFIVLYVLHHFFGPYQLSQLQDLIYVIVSH